MKILCPVKKCVWGVINNLDDLKKFIAKSGQPFGVDLSGPASDYNPLYPSDISLYKYKGWGLHAGIDIPVSDSTEIYASTDGKVCEVSDDITQGIGLVIWDSVQKCKTVYWHLKSHIVKLGDIVKQGDLIALSDNTGYSAGNHLHFELKPTDDTGTSSKPIDPIPYFVFNNMDKGKQIIRYAQAIEGYKDPNGVDYWGEIVNKEGIDGIIKYFQARVPDKIKELEDSLKL